MHTGDTSRFIVVAQQIAADRIARLLDYRRGVLAQIQVKPRVDDAVPPLFRLILQLTDSTTLDKLVEAFQIRNRLKQLFQLVVGLCQLLGLFRDQRAVLRQCSVDRLRDRLRAQRRTTQRGTVDDLISTEIAIQRRGQGQTG